MRISDRLRSGRVEHAIELVHRRSGSKGEGSELVDWPSENDIPVAKEKGIRDRMNKLSPSARQRLTSATRMQQRVKRQSSRTTTTQSTRPVVHFSRSSSAWKKANPSLATREDEWQQRDDPTPLAEHVAYEDAGRGDDEPRDASEPAQQGDVRRKTYRERARYLKSENAYFAKKGAQSNLSLKRSLDDASTVMQEERSSSSGTSSSSGRSSLSVEELSNIAMRAIKASEKSAAKTLTERMRNRRFARPDKSRHSEEKKNNALARPDTSKQTEEKTNNMKSEKVNVEPVRTVAQPPKRRVTKLQSVVANRRYGEANAAKAEVVLSFANRKGDSDKTNSSSESQQTSSTDAHQTNSSKGTGLRSSVLLSKHRPRSAALAAAHLVRPKTTTPPRQREESNGKQVANHPKDVLVPVETIARCIQIDDISCASGVSTMTHSTRQSDLDDAMTIESSASTLSTRSQRLKRLGSSPARKRFMRGPSTLDPAVVAVRNRVLNKSRAAKRSQHPAYAAKLGRTSGTQNWSDGSEERDAAESSNVQTTVEMTSSDLDSGELTELLGPPPVHRTIRDVHVEVQPEKQPEPTEMPTTRNEASYTDEVLAAQNREALPNAIARSMEPTDADGHQSNPREPDDCSDSHRGDIIQDRVNLETRNPGASEEHKQAIAMAADSAPNVSDSPRSQEGIQDYRPPNTVVPSGFADVDIDVAPRGVQSMDDSWYNNSRSEFSVPRSQEGISEYRSNEVMPSGFADFEHKGVQSMDDSWYNNSRPEFSVHRSQQDHSNEVVPPGLVELEPKGAQSMDDAWYNSPRSELSATQRRSNVRRPMKGSDDSGQSMDDARYNSPPSELSATQRRSNVRLPMKGTNGTEYERARDSAIRESFRTDPTKELTFDSGHRFDVRSKGTTQQEPNHSNRSELHDPPDSSLSDQREEGAWAATRSFPRGENELLFQDRHGNNGIVHRSQSERPAAGNDWNKTELPFNPEDAQYWESNWGNPATNQWTATQTDPNSWFQSSAVETGQPVFMASTEQPPPEKWHNDWEYDGNQFMEESWNVQKTTNVMEWKMHAQTDPPQMPPQEWSAQQWFEPPNRTQDAAAVTAMPNVDSDQVARKPSPEPEQAQQARQAQETTQNNCDGQEGTDSDAAQSYTYSTDSSMSQRLQQPARTPKIRLTEEESNLLGELIGSSGSDADLLEDAEEAHDRATSTLVGQQFVTEEEKSVGLLSDPLSDLAKQKHLANSDSSSASKKIEDSASDQELSTLIGEYHIRSPNSHSVGSRFDPRVPEQKSAADAASATTGKSSGMTFAQAGDGQGMTQTQGAATEGTGFEAKATSPPKPLAFFEGEDDVFSGISDATSSQRTSSSSLKSQKVTPTPPSEHPGQLSVPSPPSPPPPPPIPASKHPGKPSVLSPQSIASQSKDTQDGGEPDTPDVQQSENGDVFSGVGNLPKQAEKNSEFPGEISKHDFDSVTSASDRYGTLLDGHVMTAVNSDITASSVLGASVQGDILKGNLDREISQPIIEEEMSDEVDDERTSPALSSKNTGSLTEHTFLNSSQKSGVKEPEMTAAVKIDEHGMKSKAKQKTEKDNGARASFLDGSLFMNFGNSIMDMSVGLCAVPGK